MYRYTLERELGTLLEANPKHIVMCGLNPSTADADRDDPTSRRAIAFARRESGTRLMLINLYAARTTKPAGLRNFEDPVGPAPSTRGQLSARPRPRICSSQRGKNHPERAPGSAPPRSLETLREHGDVDRLGPATKEGHPAYPLYLPKTRNAHRSSCPPRGETDTTEEDETHVEEHRNERRRSSASASSCDEDNADDFSNDELLDACVRLVQEDDARAEDAASKHGPEEALIEEARRELLDHIGSLGDVTGRDRQRLRDAV